MNHFTYILMMVLLSGCSTPAVDTSPTAEPQATNTSSTNDNAATVPWHGVYVSTSEISGFSHTAMSLGPLENGQRSYRKHHHSCMSINLPELKPIIESNGNELTITERFDLKSRDGRFRDTVESKTKYTRKTINGHVVLFRDDALKQFELNNKLYDYGLLVKISDDSDSIDDLANAPHPSIRDLYEDKNSEWNDPFVHGPNARK